MFPTVHSHAPTKVWASRYFCFGPYFLLVKSGGEMNLVVLKPGFTELYGKLL